MLGGTNGLKTQATRWVDYLKKLDTVKDVYGNLLGVDLDDSSILSLQLHQTFGKVRVSCAEVAALPSRSIVEDIIVDKSAVINILKKQIEKTNIQLKNTAIAMPGSKVVIKKIKLSERLSENNAEIRAWQEARKAFPELVKNLYLDFEQVKEAEEFFLIIVMVKKEDVTPRVECLQQAGLSAKILDVDYYALERAYHLFSSQLPEKQPEQCVAIIHFNPRSILLLVMQKKFTLFFSRQNFSGDAMIPLVQQALGVESASTYAKPAVLMPFNSESQPIETALSSENTAITEELKTQAVISIRRLLQSFYTEYTGKTIACVAMTGRCALLVDLMGYIKEKLDIPMVIPNPLKTIKLAESIDAESILKLGPAFVLSLGLAMRGVHW